jgi:hypothetical protein
MAKLEQKSDVWRSSDNLRQFLDVVRHLIIIIATTVCLYSVWKIYWLIAIIVALPVYIIILNLVGFLTLPLYGLAGYAWYRLTSDGKAASEMLKHINKSEPINLDDSNNVVVEANTRKNG